MAEVGRSGNSERVEGQSLETSDNPVAGPHKNGSSNDDEDLEEVYKNSSFFSVLIDEN